MPTISECVVLHGPDLLPHHCMRFAWNRGVITAMDLGAPAPSLNRGALVVIPGLTNACTQIGDSPLVDGAAGLPPAQALASPTGPRARMFAEMPPPEQYQHVAGHLLYLARTGVVRHLDFGEPGSETTHMLREAAQRAGVESICLTRLERPPAPAAPLPLGASRPSIPAPSELGNLLNPVDGLAVDPSEVLPAPFCDEIREHTTAQRKLRTLACPAPGFADLLEQLDPHLVAPCTAIGPGEIAALKQRAKTAVLTLRAAASLGLASPPLLALLRAGMPLLLGTGSVMLSSPNLWAELDFAWKLARQQAAGESGPEPSDLLRLVTGNIHRVLGGDCHGRLETGLPADFVVLNFRHPHLRATRNLIASIVSRVTPEEVLATYRRGEPIWRVPDFKP